MAKSLLLLVLFSPGCFTPEEITINIEVGHAGVNVIQSEE